MDHPPLKNTECRNKAELKCLESLPFLHLATKLHLVVTAFVKNICSPNAGGQSCQDRYAMAYQYKSRCYGIVHSVPDLSQQTSSMKFFCFIFKGLFAEHFSCKYVERVSSDREHTKDERGCFYRVVSEPSTRKVKGERGDVCMC